MTVPTTASRAGPFAGTGAITGLPFTFKVFAQADVVVTRKSVAGVESTLTLGADYTVTLNPDQDTSPGGTVTPTVAPAVGETTTLTSGVSEEQPTDLLAGGAFRPGTIEDALDRSVILIKQLREALNRTLRVSISTAADAELPPPEAGFVIGWDDTATALRNIDPTTLATIVAYANWRTNIFDGGAASYTLDADPGSASNCDVSVSGVTQTPGVDFTVSGATLTPVVAWPAGTGNVVVRYGQALPQGITSATSITHTPPGAGAVARTQDNINRERISVFDFIPTAQHAAILAGTSTFDVSAHVGLAIAYALTRSPATVWFPTGRYYFANVIGNFTGNDVTIDGNGSVFDCSGLATGSLAYFLRFSGTYAGGAVSLTSNAAALQKTIAVNSASFAVGDMVRLYSNSVWDSTRTSTKYGELNWIETKPDGASVTLANDTASLYTTAATAKLEKVTPCRDLVIKNFTVIGPSANDLLFNMQFVLCTGLIVEGVRSYDFDTCHLQLVDCTNYKVTGCHFEESNSSGTGYGCSVADASQDGIISHNTFTNVRHSLATNNSPSTSWGITRRCLFLGNIITDSAKTTGLTGGDAIDNHAGSEDISIIGNIVFASSGSGIISEGRTAVIKGNAIYSCQGNAITHQNYTDLVGEVHISGNTIRGVVGSYGIAIVAQGAGYKAWSVNDNNINSTARALQLIGSSGKLLNKGSLCGNVLVSTTAIQAVNVEYAAYVGMSGGSIEAPSIGTLWENCSYISVTGVPVELNNAAGTTGYGHRLQGTGEGNIVAGCAMRHTGGLTAAAAVSFVNTTITNSRCYGNTAKGFTAGTVFNVGTGTGNAPDSTNNSYV